MNSIKFRRMARLLPCDVVSFNGENLVISARCNKGKDAPYFQFVAHEGSKLGNWYSYELLNDPIPGKPVVKGGAR